MGLANAPRTRRRAILLGGSALILGGVSETKAKTMETFVERNGLSLEQRLQRMEDMEDIRRLRSMYHIFINGREFGKLRQLFATNATLIFDGIVEYKGAEQIGAGLTKLGDGVSLLNQFCSQHVVDINGDTASGLADMDGYYASQGVSMVISVRYFDDYVRTSSGWRFSKMLANAFFTVPLKEGWAGERTRYLGIDEHGLRADQ